MKKEKILKKGQKVIYRATYIKPSIATVEELIQDDEIAILSNRIRIYTYLKKDKFERPDRKDGYAIPYNDETKPLIEAANFYHHLDLSQINVKLKELYEGLSKGNIEDANKILQVKRLNNKINKVFDV